MLPVLRHTASGETPVAEIRKKVTGDFRLTEAELSEMLPSGRQSRFANRVAWAILYLTGAGLLEKCGRALYRATKEGLDLLQAPPSHLDLDYLKRYPAYVEWRSGTSNSRGQAGAAPRVASSEDSGSTPEEVMEASHRALSSVLEADLLDRIRELSPAFFEALIVDLLIAMGYGGGREEMGSAIGHPGDGGIDGIIKEDPLGLDIVYMQAKRYAEGNSVGRREIQGFAGSLDGVRATKGIFVTTSSFSAGAREYAAMIAKRIILIDGTELARLMIRHNVGVRTRTAYEIKKVDEDYFTE